MTSVVTMPFAWYQSADGVSQSMLKRLGQSPAHLKAYLEKPPEPTRAMEIGTLVHSIVFGTETVDSLVHVRPETYEDKKGQVKKWNGNATECKDWFAAHEDKIVISVAELEMLGGMFSAIHAHPSAKLALATGKAEQSLFATDEDTGCKLKCRCDWLSGNAIVDLKTCEDASLDGFAKSVANYGYDVQAAFYLDICARLNLGKEYFLFVAAEKQAPYAVAVYQLDEESIEIGRRKYRFWLARYRECLERNEWPGYDPTIQLISLPDWKKRKAA